MSKKTKNHGKALISQLNTRHQKQSDNNEQEELGESSQLIKELDNMKFTKTKKQTKISLKYESSSSDGETSQQKIQEVKGTQKKQQKKVNNKNKTDQSEDEEEEKISTTDQSNKKLKKQKYNTKQNYEEIFDILYKMREKIDAPVDTQGAGCQTDPNQPKEIQDFQTFTSLLLSVQTKDETTDMVMRRLIKDGWTVDKALSLTDEELKAKIYEVNFNVKKVQYIKKSAQLIKEEYNGKIPNDYDELLTFPGVGPKIATLFFKEARDHVTGIAVDTHVHRISNRLELVNTKTPEQTKKELEKFVDKKYWGTINGALVGLGQKICKPITPLCNECDLQDKCPEGRRRRVGRGKH